MRSAFPNHSPDLSALRALPALAVLLALPLTAASPASAQAQRPGAARETADSAPLGLPWNHRLDDALAAAARSGRPILIDLFAEWCGLCRRLEREVFADPVFRDYAGERFVFLRVDIDDGGEGTRLRDRFAQSVPTTVLIDHNMARVGVVRGYHPAPLFISRLEIALQKHRELVATYREVLRQDSTPQLHSFADLLVRHGDGARAATIYRRLIERGFDPKGGQVALRFRLAESLRLSRQFAAAEDQVRLIKRYSRLAGDPELQEALGLLEIRLARDRIDCDRATDAVQAFLEAHPGSSRTVEALAALRSVELDPEAKCD